LASLCVAIELILCTVDWLKVRESILKLHPITRLQTVCLTVGSMSKLVIKNITIITFIIVIMLGIMVMVFNATFNNVSVISWQSVLLVEETGENRMSLANFIK